MRRDPACTSKYGLGLHGRYTDYGTPHRMVKTLRIVLACLLLGAGIASAQVVPGEPSLTPKSAAPAPLLRLAPKAVPSGAHLPPVSDIELQRLRDTNRSNVARKRVAIGIERPVARGLQGTTIDRWNAVAGGVAPQGSLPSPRAGAMRLSIAPSDLPPHLPEGF